MRVLSYGELRREIAAEPRLTKSQLDALRKVGRQDRDCRLLGFDENQRPVVVTRNPAGQQVIYALLRNGAPTAAGKVREEWAVS